MFETGDAVFHPVRGAGIVSDIQERQWRGGDDLFYTIDLVGQPGTRLMIPARTAEEVGLRHTISQAGLGRVWRVLRADPEALPADHKARYEVLEEKLHAGSALELAEAVRDMTWRREHQGRLTTRGKRMYDEGVTLLAGEIAAVQRIELMEAEAQLRQRLKDSLASAAMA